jgi:hypothetical protein
MRSIHLALLVVSAACVRDYGLTKVPETPPPEAIPEDSDPAPPDIEVTPTMIDFGAWLRGCPSTPQLVHIENVGGSDLLLNRVELAGQGVAAFQMRGRGHTLAPGESMDVELVFTPGRLATFNQSWVEVGSNDPVDPEVRVDLVGEGAEVALHQDSFVQNPAAAVDVLFSIDNSGSMGDDIAALGAAFDTFINSFLSLGLDFHIAVMTADPDCPNFLGPVITNQTPDAHAEFIRQTQLGACGGEAAFGATMNALAPNQLAGTNAGFLRTDANLAIVALSDEPEQTEGSGGGLFGCDPPVFTGGCLPVNSYVNFLLGLKGGDPSKVTFSGIVAPRTSALLNVFGGCDIALPAPRYHSAISLTGGVFGNLCQVDLDPFLTHLSLVVAGVSSTFNLSLAPESTAPGDLIVEVGGVQISRGAPDGYLYDPATNSIELLGDAVPEPGQVVTISYEAEGSCEE